MWSYMYIPTNENPDDLLSRDVSAEHVASSHLWMKGPEWLPDKEPVNTPHLQVPNTDTTDASPTTEQMAPVPTGIHSDIHVHHYSHLNTLLAVTAYALQFSQNVQHPDSKRSRPFSTTELIAACKLWLHTVQKSAYPKRSLTWHQSNQAVLLWGNNNGFTWMKINCWDADEKSIMHQLQNLKNSCIFHLQNMPSQTLSWWKLTNAYIMLEQVTPSQHYGRCFGCRRFTSKLRSYFITMLHATILQGNRTPLWIHHLRLIKVCVN